ncbi:hypothetical protein G7046_g8928 [Stylonectria norvegica]|nr:hypothetical protein G7046_g8928 [Stylonectria norvegica]
MQRAERMVVEQEPSWEEDTIYCEATCCPVDIFYEGSDDEDYDSPTSRRLRYEAAGQLYLHGQAPFLLTATLKGPFDSASGWVNPWRSKHRTAGAMPGTRTSPTKPIQQRRQKREVSIPETTQVDVQNSLECHLPSPESLKQPSLAESHPYLEEDELAMVQNWRDTLQPSYLAKDDFWAPTPQATVSARKRQAKGSEWLRKVASKRRKTDIMETGTVNTPMPRRPGLRTSLLETTTLPDDINISFGTSFDIAPFRIPSATKPFPSNAPDFEPETDTQEIEDEDERIDPIHHSFSSALVNPDSSFRRIPSQRSVQRIITNERAKESEDELSQEHIVALNAAGSLSSPVSQHRSTKSPSQPSSSRRIMSPPTLTRRSTNRSNSSKQNLLAQSPTRDLIVAQITVPVPEQATAQTEGTKASPDFETQEDESFCFKMRSKQLLEGEVSDIDADAGVLEEDSSSDVSSICSESESWAGFSSGEENGDLPAPPDSASEVSGANQPNTEIPNVKSMLYAPESVSAESSIGSTKSSVLSSIPSAKFAGFEYSTLSSDGPKDMETLSDRLDHKLDGEPGESIIVAGDHMSQLMASQQVEAIVPGRSSNQRENVQNSPMASNTKSPTPQRSSVEVKSDFEDTTMTVDAWDSSPTMLEQGPSEMLDGVRQTLSPLSAPIEAVGSNSGLSPSLPWNESPSSSTPRSSWVELVHPTSAPESSPAPATNDEEDCQPQPDDAISNTTSDGDSEPGQQADDTASTITSDVALDSETSALKNTQMHKSTDGEVSSPDKNNSLESAPVGSPTSQQSRLEQEVSRATEAMEVERTEGSPLSCSQQTPWGETQLSQYAALVNSNVLQDGASPGLVSTPQKSHKSSTMPPPETQTPWGTGSFKLPAVLQAPTPRAGAVTQDSPSQLPSGNSLASSVDRQTPFCENLGTPSNAGRPSIPEPQFSVKSFASFMSPSPERRPRQSGRASWRKSGSRLPSTQGVLASATRNPWDHEKRERRVSWAPLPDEKTEIPSSPLAKENQFPHQSRGRQLSPPPMTPLSDLPTAVDAKFHDHFTAVKLRKLRTNVLRPCLHPSASQRLLPTESQRTLGSPEAGAMAEKFLAADDIRKGDSENMEEPYYSEHNQDMLNGHGSQDSMDIVDEVYREMSDYLETWNVDEELDQARRGDIVQTPSAGFEVQSPW